MGSVSNRRRVCTYMIMIMRCAGFLRACTEYIFFFEFVSCLHINFSLTVSRQLRPNCYCHMQGNKYSFRMHTYNKQLPTQFPWSNFQFPTWHFMSWSWCIHKCISAYFSQCLDLSVHLAGSAMVFWMQPTNNPSFSCMGISNNTIQLLSTCDPIKIVEQQFFMSPVMSSENIQDADTTSQPTTWYGSRIWSIKLWAEANRLCAYSLKFSGILICQFENSAILSATIPYTGVV